MKEHPILFSGEMVRAILDGRKTQTRRVVLRREKDEGEWVTARPDRGYTAETITREYRNPFGQSGDRLWVRESYRYFHESDWIQGDGDTDYNDEQIDQEHARFEADLRWGTRRDNGRGGKVERVQYLDESTPIENDITLRVCYRRRPSIHMPRWASRIALEITGVRVERVQEISDTDAMAEGALLEEDGWHDPRYWYEDLFDSLNAKRGYGWDVNPWVWVIEFKRAEDARAAA